MGMASAPERAGVSAHKGGAGATPRHGGSGRRLPTSPPNHPGESHERSMGSKVPVGSLSPRGSVRTATALPDRRNASAGPCPIRPQVGLAPHSGTDTSQAGKGYPSLGTVRFALPAILTSCDKPEDPNA